MLSCANCKLTPICEVFEDIFRFNFKAITGDELRVKAEIVTIIATNCKFYAEEETENKEEK